MDDPVLGSRRVDTRVVRIQHPPTFPNLPQEFHKFCQLPPEVRLVIWEMALPSSITVRREWNSRKARFGLVRDVPGILQACFESRETFTTTKGTGNSIASRYELVNIHVSEDTAVYLNWTTDSLWIRRGCRSTKSVHTH